MPCGRQERPWATAPSASAAGPGTKGNSRKRSAAAIASYLDRLGGELNAYTTKEEIVIHATVLKEDLPKAIGLLLELATEASFPEREVETERGVVIDEIISYKDSPSEDVYDRFEEALFAGHPLCRPILGTAASVRKITPADLHRFRAAFFRPERMALTVVSPLEEPRMEKDVKRLTEKYFPAFGTGDAPTPEAGHGNAGTPDEGTGNATPEAGNGESRAPAAPPFDRTVNKRNHEVNAVIGGRAPSLYEPKDRITAVLLTNILGGPASNSLLNSELREKKGWVYGIECSYTQYADTGIMAITFGCDKPNPERPAAVRTAAQGGEKATRRPARRRLGERRGPLPVNGQEPPRVRPHQHGRGKPRRHRCGHGRRHPPDGGTRLRRAFAPDLPVRITSGQCGPFPASICLSELEPPPDGRSEGLQAASPFPGCRALP